MTSNCNTRTICRFCLYSGYQNWHQLSENNEVMNKIQTCLTIQLSPNKHLPSQICQVCFDKIEDIYRFHLNITENEKRLNNYLQDVESNLENSSNIDRDINNIQIIDKTEFIETAETKIKKEEPTELDSDHNFCSEDEKPLTIVKIKNEKDKHKKKEDKISIKVEKQLKCLMCFQMCDSLKLLIRHYNTEHTDKDYLDSIKATYSVETSEDGSKVFKCGHCSKNWFSKRCIERHWILMHVKNRPFICKLCSRTYKTASDLVRHARIHIEDCRMFCPYHCGFSTLYKGAMNDHKKRHRNDFKYTCSDCGRGFNVQTSYTQHLNKHKGLKPFVCDICGMAFTMDKYLYQHKIKVHEVSSSTKRYICVHCLLPFDSKHVLNQHLKEHGKIITFHLCDICGKHFPTSSKLRIHKNTHLGIRPYSCSLCPKTFAKRCNLKLHEVTHTGEKNYTCSHCGKHYTQKSAMQRHVSKHHSQAITGSNT